LREVAGRRREGSSHLLSDDREIFAQVSRRPVQGVANSRRSRGEIGILLLLIPRKTPIFGVAIGLFFPV
jgi:hypothetical protein